MYKAPLVALCMYWINNDYWSLYIGESSSQKEKCDVVENSAYGITVQGSAGDRLEPDYNMENNPLYEMRSLSNDTHSHKTQTAVPVYETVDSVVP